MTIGYTVVSRPDPRDEPLERNSEFCLCGRDPDSVEVREELIKAITLSMRYDLAQGGCLCDAAAAFDEVVASLVPDEAQTWSSSGRALTAWLKSQRRDLNIQ